MQIDRIDPPFWFTGMEDRCLQLLLYGSNLRVDRIETDIPTSADIEINECSYDYALINVLLRQDAQPGEYWIDFIKADGESVRVSYVLKARHYRKDKHYSITESDCIYMIMPDRFSGYREKLSDDPDAWHGGTLKCLTGKLDYISHLGVTILWLSPVFKNQQKLFAGKYSSYHGYAITDYYDIDRHFGDISDYCKFVDAAHRHGLKVVMDIVFNHCSIEHPFVKKPPHPGCINSLAANGITNYQIATAYDMYASPAEQAETVKGWFTSDMADINLSDSVMLKYLTEVTIWWIEVAGIDGYRMDTIMYSDRQAMQKWLAAIQNEYPGLTVIGETWVNLPSLTAAIQRDFLKVNSSFVGMDFSFQRSVCSFVNGDADALYMHFVEDFLYEKPQRMLAFADNHDLPRLAHEVDDSKKIKQILGVLLTVPRIPQILYGTECLLAGSGRELGDGYYRQDFPGGWPKDECNKFLRKGRTSTENRIHDFIKRILQWRRRSPAIAHGKMVHYIPRNGVYVYFRTSKDESVMVILNVGRRQELQLEKYREILQEFSYGVDIPSGKVYRVDNPTLKLYRSSILILALHP